MRIRASVMAVLVVAASFALPTLAGAANATATTASKATTNTSKATTNTYDLDFTLPTYGKSGCTVCHSDPNLVKVSGDTTSSLYVDPAKMSAGPHATTLCTGCHVDFANKTPHENVAKGTNWRSVAKSSCKTCHQDAYAMITKSVHSPVGGPGATSTVSASVNSTATVPLCGDCHGGHDIVSAQEMTSSPLFHASGLEMCGQCHSEFTDSYRDYYHGAAYQRHAIDSPACWECHTAHSTLSTDARGSSVGEGGIEETCGQAGCHDDPNTDFVSYSELIHNQEAAYDTVPILTFVESTKAAIGKAFDSVTSLFSS